MCNGSAYLTSRLELTYPLDKSGEIAECRSCRKERKTRGEHCREPDTSESILPSMKPVQQKPHSSQSFLLTDNPPTTVFPLCCPHTSTVMTQYTKSHMFVSSKLKGSFSVHLSQRCFKRLAVSTSRPSYASREGFSISALVSSYRESRIEIQRHVRVRNAGM
jgi:hypothetical protein